MIGESSVGCVCQDVAYDDIFGDGKILLSWISTGMKMQAAYQGSCYVLEQDCDLLKPTRTIF